MQIFQMFDKDGSGAIDAEELHEALKSMGKSFSETVHPRPGVVRRPDSHCGDVTSRHCYTIGVSFPKCVSALPVFRAFRGVYARWCVCGGVCEFRRRFAGWCEVFAGSRCGCSVMCSVYALW